MDNEFPKQSEIYDHATCASPFYISAQIIVLYCIVLYLLLLF